MASEADGSMLAPEDLPAKHARVMRVVDSSTPKPSPQPSKQTTPKPADQPSSASTASSSASGKSASDRAEVKETLSRFTEEFASSDEETSAGGRTTDDGWNVVAAKPKSAFEATTRPSTVVLSFAVVACAQVAVFISEIRRGLGDSLDGPLTLRTHIPLALAVCRLGSDVHRFACIYQDSTEERQKSRGQKGRQSGRGGGSFAAAQDAQEGFGAASQATVQLKRR